MMRDDAYITLDCRDRQHAACAICSCACHLTSKAVPHSSVPQAEAPVRIPSAPAPDAVPNASTVAVPAPLGAATHPITVREALAASAVGIAIALAGVAPAAATADSGAGTTPTGDGLLVVALLVAVALLVVAALLHGRPRRARRVVEPGCCLVEHGPADDDEVAAGVGER